MNEKKITDILVFLPSEPGVYQYFDREGKIIYIGKAKNLKKRVYSYFSKDHSDNGKLRVMVSKIADIKYIVVDSESDALLLENNLIKKYQPRYNILLKDDKTFPWICIKNERFPRVFSTRNIVEDGSQYFGPYTSGFMVKTMLDLFKKLYPLRNCNYELDDDKIFSNKYKPCLEFHIGNCKAPCIGRYDIADYDENIRQIKEVLKGNISGLTQFLKDVMNDFSKQYKFEYAQNIKEKLESLEKFQSKSTVVNVNINNVDVFSFVQDANHSFVNYLRVINGSIIQSHTIDVVNQLDESKEELFSTIIADIRQRMYSTSPEIILPFYPDIKERNIKYTIPQIGDKLKLLELSERNVKYFILEKNKRISEKSEFLPSFSILERMRLDLQMDVQPVHIECFDNSNIQGTNPVAACVVFKNAKPSKRDYRHFNVKTVEGPNDFASMEEIIYRRYRRVLDDGDSLPNLIVIDGGKGQLSSAMKIFNQLNIADKVTVIGLAKRLEEIFFPNDSVPLYIDKKSETLRVIQHIRNEAHRFGISFHRQKRSSNFIVSELDSIKGIGEKTKTVLYEKFGDINGIKLATSEQLSEVLDDAKIKLIVDYFALKSKIL